jgi:hypothetical protein
MASCFLLCQSFWSDGRLCLTRENPEIANPRRFLYYFAPAPHVIH